MPLQLPPSRPNSKEGTIIFQNNFLGGKLDISKNKVYAEYRNYLLKDSCNFVLDNNLRLIRRVGLTEQLGDDQEMDIIPRIYFYNTYFQEIIYVLYEVRKHNIEDEFVLLDKNFKRVARYRGSVFVDEKGSRIRASNVDLSKLLYGIVFEKKRTEPVNPEWNTKYSSNPFTLIFQTNYTDELQTKKGVFILEDFVGEISGTPEGIKSNCFKVISPFFKENTIKQISTEKKPSFFKICFGRANVDSYLPIYFSRTEQNFILTFYISYNRLNPDLTKSIIILLFNEILNPNSTYPGFLNWVSPTLINPISSLLGLPKWTDRAYLEYYSVDSDASTHYTSVLNLIKPGTMLYSGQGGIGEVSQVNIYDVQDLDKLPYYSKIPYQTKLPDGMNLLTRILEIKGIVITPFEEEHVKNSSNFISGPFNDGKGIYIDGGLVKTEEPDFNKGVGFYNNRFYCVSGNSLYFSAIGSYFDFSNPSGLESGAFVANFINIRWVVVCAGSLLVFTDDGIFLQSRSSSSIIFEKISVYVVSDKINPVIGLNRCFFVLNDEVTIMYVDIQDRMLVAQYIIVNKHLTEKKKIKKILLTYRKQPSCENELYIFYSYIDKSNTEYIDIDIDFDICYVDLLSTHPSRGAPQLVGSFFPQRIRLDKIPPYLENGRIVKPYILQDNLDNIFVCNNKIYIGFTDQNAPTARIKSLRILFLPKDENDFFENFPNPSLYLLYTDTWFYESPLGSMVTWDFLNSFITTNDVLNFHNEYDIISFLKKEGMKMSRIHMDIYDTGKFELNISGNIFNWIFEDNKRSAFFDNEQLNSSIESNFRDKEKIHYFSHKRISFDNLPFPEYENVISGYYTIESPLQDSESTILNLTIKSFKNRPINIGSIVIEYK